MKILYFGYPSGAGRAPHQEMAALQCARQGHDVDHVCWGGSADDYALADAGINYFPQPKKGVFSALKLLAYLFRAVYIRRAYDVIYVQGAQQTPFVFWVPMLKGSAHVVYHSQDYLEPRRHRFYEMFERWFAKRADYVISNEVNRGRFMKSYYGLPHMPAVIRTALPTWWKIPDRSEKMRDALLLESGIGNPEEAVVIIAGGPYRADRMTPQLLDAFKRLPDNYVLVFNGPAMAPGKPCRLACEYHMKVLEITERVVFRSGLTFEQLMELYSIGEIGMLLYPNDGVGHFYQCPGRFSEYLRNGLSLISSDFPGLELLTLKYELGAVCDAEKPESIAEAIQRIGPVAKARRQKILKVTRREFVYECGSGILEEILDGTYKKFKPSVVT